MASKFNERHKQTRKSRGYIATGDGYALFNDKVVLVSNLMFDGFLGNKARLAFTVRYQEGTTFTWAGLVPILYDAHTSWLGLKKTTVAVTDFNRYAKAFPDKLKQIKAKRQEILDYVSCC